MQAEIKDQMFREPDGWLWGSLWLSAATILCGIYLYEGVIGGEGLFILAIASVLSGLNGIAEVLPPDRRQEAGYLRISSIVAALPILVLAVFAPTLLF